MVYKNGDIITALTKMREKGLPVVGVPKTIDNDLDGTVVTFGFDTAVTVAAGAIEAAHVEASGAPSGVGIVKLEFADGSGDSLRGGDQRRGRAGLAGR